jgi:hypothetical protein
MSYQVIQVKCEERTGNEHPEMLINFSKKTSGTSNGNFAMNFGKKPKKTVGSNKTSSFKCSEIHS